MIISLFAEAIAEEEDKVITAGTGTGQPTGLTNCSIGSVAVSGNLSFDDIINLIYLLPSKYRTNAKFLVHNTNIKELRKLKDSQNRYLWNEAVAPGQPATFYGYPVIENNWLPESKAKKFRSLKISSDYGKIQRWTTLAKQAVAVQAQRLSEETNNTIRKMKQLWLVLFEATVRPLTII